MKLEVGMYVRTKKGIFQIINKNVFIENKKQYIGVNGRYTCIDIETIEKASHTLLGNGKEPCLIEPGDIVVLINGLKKEELMLIKDLDKQKCILETHKIVSIVTKEQFESMEYKVVEEC